MKSDEGYSQFRVTVIAAIVIFILAAITIAIASTLAMAIINA